MNSEPDEKSHVEGVQNLRRSGAYGSHLNRADRRARTRQAKLARELRERENED